MVSVPLLDGSNRHELMLFGCFSIDMIILIVIQYINNNNIKKYNVKFKEKINNVVSILILSYQYSTVVVPQFVVHLYNHSLMTTTAF